MFFKLSSFFVRTVLCKSSSIVKLTVKSFLIFEIGPVLENKLVFWSWVLLFFRKLNSLFSCKLDFWLNTPVPPDHNWREELGHRMSIKCIFKSFWDVFLSIFDYLIQFNSSKTLLHAKIREEILRKLNLFTAFFILLCNRFLL